MNNVSQLKNVSFPCSAWECIFDSQKVRFTAYLSSGMHSHGGPWERVFCLFELN